MWGLKECQVKKCDPPFMTRASKLEEYELITTVLSSAIFLKPNILLEPAYFFYTNRA